MTSRTFDAKRARALYGEGHSCRSIARSLGVAASSVSDWAKREGLRFDRSQTDLATRAHMVDVRAARLELTQKALLIASDLADRMDEPYLVYSFGGRDNTYSEHVLDRAPAEVVRNVLTTVAIAVDKASKLLESVDDGPAEARSMLGELASKLGVLHVGDESATVALGGGVDSVGVADGSDAAADVVSS